MMLLVLPHFIFVSLTRLLIEHLHVCSTDIWGWDGTIEEANDVVRLVFRRTHAVIKVPTDVVRDALDRAIW
jgi:hypothetical protein